MGEAVSLYKDEFLKDDSAFYLIHLYIRAIFYIFAGNKKNRQNYSGIEKRSPSEMRVIKQALFLIETGLIYWST